MKPQCAAEENKRRKEQRGAKQGEGKAEETNTDGDKQTKEGSGHRRNNEQKKTTEATRL
jgi:hypothetical protein